ncbi:Ternary complex factor MIP1, leucine-zipper [Trema orientale]|uniref:Ternary complex factor MIP1, leucine-zipper n=1 Tax=Trema orientale TaxID=63057 RepID=A0A2P5FTS6_TREOI|nr:Ternary complex factor MIP1, leucine-zipper [Trema orientale]
MASQLAGGDYGGTPAEIRKKKLSGQRKREELEREVSLLQNMLNQEEKVHEVLDHVHNQHNGAAITIPNFLPPKMKELLAELVMVEGEIARLEGQISQIKLGLKQEQQANKESKSKQWRYGSPIRSVVHPSSFTFPSPMHNAVQSERMGYETKTLHFISKAIKGDYNLNNDFSLNERRGNVRGFGDQKENFFHEEKLQERVPRKSGMLKPASPMRDPRNPSPKPMRYPGAPLELLPKPVSIPVHSEGNIQNWQPNKLAEEIMKCLNLIYIRLLRTTRAMELEKSGPISRSVHSSLSSRSFRVEAALTSKESRQQDPYGIFNLEESIPRDIGPYKNLVIFTASSMDPKCISSPSSVPLLRKLRLLMNNLQTVELRSLTYHQKLAFWINMYNACIMHGFIQYGVPSTPEKLLTLMNKAILNIGGNIINAQAIEHYILRKSAPSSMKEASKTGENDDKESVVRELYGLESTDPNVTFALCCGTRSSPAVRMYTAESVVAELERSKLEYLQASVIVTSTKKIAFPELLLKNMLDFAADKELLVEWVCHQLPTAGSLRKSIVDCFRSHNSGRITTATVEKIPYDFEFQYLLAI